MRTTIPLAAVSLALLAGCGRDLHRGGGLPSGVDVYRILPKTGVDGNQVSCPSYVITANTDGGSDTSYRVLWDGCSTTHHFYGSMWSTGDFTAVAGGCTSGECALEGGDFVSMPHAVPGGTRLDWDTFAGADIDGMDVVSTRPLVYFDLFIDDVRRPADVAFPSTDFMGAPAPAGTIPFGLQL